MTKKLLNAKNRFGYTPLMLAVSRGNIACVEQLEKLEWVDWKTTNYRGETLVDVTRFCDPKTKNIMKYIIQRNCDCQRPGRGENR